MHFGFILIFNFGVLVVCGLRWLWGFLGDHGNLMKLLCFFLIGLGMGFFLDLFGFS